MVYDELDYVVNVIPHDVHDPKIGGKVSTAGGMEHPLWTVLNTDIPWRELRPKTRKMVERAADFLHASNIPYSFYSNFLSRFNKEYLKKKPMVLLAYKPRKDGTYQILQEYVQLFNYARECFIENSEILRLNDALYIRFSEAYEMGTAKFVESLHLIRGALKRNMDVKGLYAYLSRVDDTTEFWHHLSIDTMDYPDGINPIEVDLNDGYESMETVRLLRAEMSLRQGRSVGLINDKFNRYFKKDGTLNVQGLKILSGERSL